MKVIRVEKKVDQPKIFIYESELEFIGRCTMDFPENETGGDLFGLWTKENFPVVQYVIGPGEKTTRTPASFFQDIDYLKECGYLLNKKFGLEHIGGWHSHHSLLLSEPSTGDVQTMKNALNENSPFSRFLITICNIDPEDDVSLNGYMFKRENIRSYSMCTWIVLEGTSPVREALERQEAGLLNLFPEPQTEAATYYLQNAEMADETDEHHIHEKPELPQDSFFRRNEGQKYLKEVFDKMHLREDLNSVELLQLADKRVAIYFRHNGSSYELRFPHNFPKEKAEIVEKVKVDDLVKIFRSGKKQKSRMRKFLDSLNILKDNA